MGLVESLSGIRGKYGEDITEELAARYAACFHSLLMEWTDNPSPKIVIGHDTRPSSLKLKEAMIKMLSEVIDVDMVSTPMCEHAVREHKADGGIMITASHNEPQDNGWKFLRADGAVIEPEKSQQVIDLCHSDEEFDFGEPSVRCIPGYQSRISYAGFLRSTLGKENRELIRQARPKIIIDPNGGSGVHYKELLENLGIQVYCKNCVSGMFCRKVEPTIDSLKELQPLIEEKGAILAAGFDCDADRVELLTSSKYLSGNHVLAMVIDAVLEGSQGESVVINDATSGIVHEVARKHGANVVEAQVGEINVVDKMLSLRAKVGGEGSSSGGIIFPSRCRDGLHSLLFVLLLSIKHNKSVDELLDSYPEYYNVRENLRLPSDKIPGFQQRFVNYCQSLGADIRNADSIKGVLDDGWVWMRASRTESGVIRVIADSKNYSRANELLSGAVHALTQD